MDGGARGGVQQPGAAAALLAGSSRLPLSRREPGRPASLHPRISSPASMSLSFFRHEDRIVFTYVPLVAMGTSTVFA